VERLLAVRVGGERWKGRGVGKVWEVGRGEDWSLGNLTGFF